MSLEVMQHVRLTAALWVVGCVITVEGFPQKTQEDNRQSPRYLGYTPSLASCHGELVGSGISVTVNQECAGTHFTLDRLSNALSAVNTQSLSIALGVLNVSKKVANSVDLNSILENLLAGQASGNVLNYETVTVFLEELFGVLPQLKKTLEAYKTVSFVINKIKQHRKEGKKIDAVNLMRGVVDTYFKCLDPAFKKKMVDLSPQIKAAAFGDKDAARSVAIALADRTTVIEALKGMGYAGPVKAIQKVITQVCEYADKIKNAKTNKNMKS